MTTVTWTVTDTSGNTATCLQTVTVTDTEAPTIACPATLTTTNDVGQCFATGISLGLPVATNDNCGILAVTHNAPVQFPKGVTTVTWTVTDTSGNTATCLQTVTVIGELVISSTVWDRANLIFFCGTGGCAGSTYYVLASTNMAEAMTNWVPVATNTFGVDGSFCVTNAVDANKPAQFFRLQVP